MQDNQSTSRRSTAYDMRCAAYRTVRVLRVMACVHLVSSVRVTVVEHAVWYDLAAAKRRGSTAPDLFPRDLQGERLSRRYAFDLLASKSSPSGKRDFHYIQFNM